VSIVAKVVSVSGSGSLAAVTVQAPRDAGTFVIQANDAYAVQQYYNSKDSADASDTYPAVSLDGKHYGAAYDDLTVMGVVSAISGSGQSAILTVTLKTSGNSIQTAAGNCNSDNV
jgi:hypothetical protein